MNKIIGVGIIFGISLIGCGGGDGFTVESTATTSGAAGKDLGKSGSSGKGGTGGAVVMVLGAAGVAGSTAASGAAGQDPTNPNCRPMSCLTIAMQLSGNDLNSNACGKVSDGCGGWIDCGNCNGAVAGSGFACGEDVIGTNDSNYGKNINNKNLCGIPCWVDTKKLGYASSICGTVMNMPNPTLCQTETAKTQKITSGLCQDMSLTPPIGMYGILCCKS